MSFNIQLLISVEIPLTWGRYINDVMEALRAQTFQDFEVCVALSSDSPMVTDTLKQYDVKIVKSGPTILVKRYDAHSIAKGERSLLLDETRMPRLNLLKKLDERPESMVVIGEIDKGSKILSYFSNYDKKESIASRIIDPIRGFVLPRFFDAKILDESFRKIKGNLSPQIFNRVLMEDHQLIYFEAFKQSQDVGILEEPLLIHMAEKNILEFSRKYFRYGLYHNTLFGTPYEALISISNRNRGKLGNEPIKGYILQVLRGIPFTYGYLLSRAR